MTRLGLLGARADAGGLGSQTREFHRHLRPDRTLLVDLGRGGRGPCHPGWYPGATVVAGVEDAIDDRTLDAFLDGLDALWAAETPYRADAFRRAAALGVRGVVTANPELWRADYHPPERILLPTPWEAGRIPGATVLPFPVARDRLPFRRRTSARTFVHVAAPAMMDRNGTRIVMAALRHVTRRCTLLVRGPLRSRPPSRIGRVTVRWDASAREDYWRAWPDDGDVLLMPRRYGGLCLPMQEAMSLGMPVVSLDLPPQNAWLPPETLVPVLRSVPRPMVGGAFGVAEAEPRLLARVMDRLAGDDALVARCSDLADAHAAAISWDALLPRYREEFCGG